MTVGGFSQGMGVPSGWRTINGYALQGASGGYTWTAWTPNASTTGTASDADAAREAATAALKRLKESAG